MYLEGFNTQPPEGGCKMGLEVSQSGGSFNTQPREGGCLLSSLFPQNIRVSTHSRAKAAANFPIMVAYCYLVSTHSRAKAAARSRRLESLVPLFQHTAARRRLHFAPSSRSNLMKFQHTAARRRLQSAVDFCGHKAFCFNTQPREGGCNTSIDNKPIFSVSTHSRAKAAAQSNTFS